MDSQHMIAVLLVFILMYRLFELSSSSLVDGNAYINVDCMRKNYL